MNVNQFDDNMKNSLFNRESKAELLQIKNEILSGVKESQKLTDNKLNVFKETTQNKLTKFEEKLNKLLEKIDWLKDEIEVKHTIKDYGISEEDFLATLDEMSEQAFDDQCTGANPRYPLISEIKDLYLKVYYGGER